MLRRFSSSVLFLLTLTASQAADAPRIRDVIYGRKAGMALTMDVLKPDRPNGIGVIFMLSGGFHSDIAMADGGFFSQSILKPFTDRGQTVFLVCHGSQPKFNVPEIVSDIHRAVRFIRTHAGDYGVDPDRLGITGASSGGYLSLTIGTTGGPGDAKAKDPIDRASSQVQAVACFFPPADLVDYGQTGRSFVEYDPVKVFWHCFAVDGQSRDEQVKVLRSLSPIAAISETSAPTFIITGDNDVLVPHEQSVRFIEKLKEHKVATKLDIRPGEGHGWAELPKDFNLFAEWFEERLPAVGK